MAEIDPTEFGGVPLDQSLNPEDYGAIKVAGRHTPLEVSSAASPAQYNINNAESDAQVQDRVTRDFLREMRRQMDLVTPPLVVENEKAGSDAQRIALQNQFGPFGRIAGGLLNAELGIPQPKLTPDQKEQLANRNQAVMQGMREVMQGFTQFGADVLERTGILKPGTTEKYTKEVNQQRFEFNQSHPGTKFDQALGNVAPFLLIPGPKGVPKGLSPEAAKAYSLTLGSRGKRIMWNAAQGGVIGFTQFSENNEYSERAIAATTGALLQGGLSTAMETFSFFRPKNFLNWSLGLQDMISSPEAQATRDLFAKRKVPLRISQETGDVVVHSWEDAVKRSWFGARPAQKIENTQFQAAIDSLKADMDSIAKTGKTDAEVGKSIVEAYEKITKDIRTTRSAEWKRLMGQAEQVSKTRFIPTNNLHTAMENLIKEMNSPLAGTDTLKTVEKLYEELQKLGSLKGVVNIKDANVLLQKYTDAAEGSGRIWSDIDNASERRIAIVLKKAFQEDLNLIHNLPAEDLAKLPTDAQTGVRFLQEARKSYQVHSQALDEIKSSVMGTYVNRGLRTESQNVSAVAAETISDIVRKKAPSDVEYLAKFLEKNDPLTLQSLKRNWLEEAMDKATKRKPNDLSTSLAFDPEIFFKEASIESPNFAKLFRNPAERARVKEGVELVKKLAEGRQGVGVTESLTAESVQGARNVAPTSVTFQVGQIVKILAPPVYARAFFTEQGINSLRVLADPKKYRPAVVTEAAFYLMSLRDEE